MLKNSGKSVRSWSERGSDDRLLTLPVTALRTSFVYLMVTLHPFLGDLLHWRTRRTHRSTRFCRSCGHTAHALRPSSRQFLMGLRVECIKMEEQLLLLENPLLKVLLLLEDERSDWVNPNFYEREKCGEFQTLFPMLLEQAHNFFSLF